MAMRLPAGRMWGASPQARLAAALNPTRLAALLDGKPLLAVALSVLAFSFLGPLAALIVVATTLDHEFAHRFLMRLLGYRPGPVRIVPLLGAFVRAGRPMLRSADIALIYLAGPLIGVLSAAVVSLVAAHALPSPLAHQIYLGAAVSIALNLFNLLPIEPLDGGLISRVLPYPALLLFPAALFLVLMRLDLLTTPIGVVIVGGAVVITLRKVRGWRRYVAALRLRLKAGDLRALRELRASFEVPLLERVLVVMTYVLLVAGAMGLLEVLVRAGGWLS